MFTDSWVDVKQSGPYNIVLMYDVIDHMMQNEQEIIDKLKQIKQILAINGKIYLRSHPWCSRHGTHLYHQLNKAFAHLIFSDEELQILGYKQEPVRKVLAPVAEYKNLFQAAGLKVQSGPHPIKEAVEQFFMKPILSKRITDHYKNCIREDLRHGKFPSTPLEIQFLDYILI
jgi:hypothetical protein